MSRKRVEMQPGIAYFVFPIGDTPDQDIFSLFEKSYGLLDDNLKKGNVLVNCNMGISRSTTIVMAYMMKKTGLSHIQCLEICRKYRGCCNPNPGFMDQLEDWHYHLKSLRAAEPAKPPPDTKPKPAPALHFFDDSAIVIEGSVVTIPNFVNPNAQHWVEQPAPRGQTLPPQSWIPISTQAPPITLSSRYRSESDPPTLANASRPRSSSWDVQVANSSDQPTGLQPPAPNLRTVRSSSHIDGVSRVNETDAPKERQSRGSFQAPGFTSRTFL